MPEPQQRPQGRGQLLSRLRRQPPGLGGQERRHIAGRQPPRIRAGHSDAARHERADHIEVTAGYLDLKAAFAQQVAAVPLKQLFRPIPRCGELGIRTRAQCAQVAQQRRQGLRRQVRRIPAGTACRQVRLHRRAGQIRRAQPGGLQPPAQVRGQPELASRGQLRKAQPGQLTGQTPRMRSQRARHADPIQHIHHLSSPIVGENSVTPQRARLCRYPPPGHHRRPAQTHLISA